MRNRQFSAPMICALMLLAVACASEPPPPQDDAGRFKAAIAERCERETENVEAVPDDPAYCACMADYFLNEAVMGALVANLPSGSFTPSASRETLAGSVSATNRANLLACLEKTGVQLR